MGELREFIYIDNDSLNNNLSSLGHGVPSEITHSSGDQTEKGGSAGGRFAGVGADGEYRNVDSEEVETTLDITAPYRFQNLLDEIEDAEIEVKENLDPRGLNRSDLVKISGDFHPMALLKFDMALDAFETFIDEEFNEMLRELGSQTMASPQQADQIRSFKKVIEKFSGNEFPVRIERGDDQYCVPLQRSKMRESIYDAFQETQEYTMYGRVKRHIPANEQWQPVHALDVISQYGSDDGQAEEFLNDMEENAEDLHISIQEKDKSVRGHTAVIDPIAIYW